MTCIIYAGPAPKTLRDNFNTLIPYVLDHDEGEIPLDANTADPLSSTYGELGAIAYLPIPSPKVNYKERTVFISPPPNSAEVTKFLAHLLQYYVIRLVASMEHPRVTENWESGKGITLNPTDSVSAPAAKVYPTKQLFALWPSLGLAFSVNGGVDDWMWRDCPLELPQRTVLSLSETPTFYTVRFERKSYYRLDFRITPSGHNKGLSTLPGNFQFDTPISDIKDPSSYAFIVTMEFSWHAKDRAEYEDYAEWAQDVFAVLKRHLAPPGNK
jgi:hypothetical protein